MSPRWRIVSRLKCVSQNEDGEIDECGPLSIRPGDLVDVAVTVAVVLKSTAFVRKCDMFFEPCTIVRLKSAGNMG